MPYTTLYLLRPRSGLPLDIKGKQMKYKYSPTLEAFFPADMLDDYAHLPDDLIDVSEQTYDSVLSARAQGLAYRIGDDGASASVAPSATHYWDGKAGKWVFNAEKQAEIDAQIIKAAIPSVVTMRQAKLAMLQMDLLDEVDAVIAAPETPRSLKIEWEYGSEVSRDWVDTLGMANMGLSDKQLDDLFILAGTK